MARSHFPISSAALLVLLVVSPLLAEDIPPEIENAKLSAVGEINGGSSGSTHYQLNATSGQLAATTNSTSAHYADCSGFECVLNTLALYLPMMSQKPVKRVFVALESTAPLALFCSVADRFMHRFLTRRATLLLLYIYNSNV